MINLFRRMLKKPVTHNFSAGWAHLSVKGHLSPKNTLILMGEEAAFGTGTVQVGDFVLVKSWNGWIEKWVVVKAETNPLAPYQWSAEAEPVKQ